MSRPLRYALVAVLAVVSGFLAVAMIGYSSGQVGGGASPAGLNPMGLVGAWAAHAVIHAWGVVGFLLPVLGLGYAVALWRDYDLSDLGRRLAGAVLLLPALCGLVHLVPYGTPGLRLLTTWDQLQLQGLGGVLGHLLCAPVVRAPGGEVVGGFLVRWLDVAGSSAVLLVVAFGALLLMDIGLGRWLHRLWRAARHEAERASRHEQPQAASEAFVPRAEPVAKNRQTTSIHEVASILQRIEQAEPAVPAEAEQLIERIRAHRRQLEQSGRLPEPEPARAAAPARSAALDARSASEAEPSAVAAEPQEAVEPAGEAEAAPASRPRPPRPRTERVDGDPDGYVLPPIDLLEANKVRKDAEHEAEKAQISKAIEQVFADFDITVQVVAATRGPVVTQYEIRLLDQSMRVNKVEGFEKDLAMKLGTEGIRIVAPLPNKTTIGIEVPNKVKEAVVMRDLVEAVDPATMALPVILGRDAVGRPMIADLAKMPHLLVAGATGMGKSVCMNAMICSVLLFRSPHEVKFIMIDPKMVELAGYEDIPHLLAPPITDMTKAHAALEWACKTMDQRYEVLKATNVRNIADYNALGEDEIRFRLAKKELRLEDLPEAKAFMPFIVLLVDEYADLMMVNKEVEKSIVRLAAKSRAAGLHVILTTQRPSADVVTGLIKSNLPSRICFRVVDKNNSRVVLDVSGAENLLGKGDMLFLQPGTSMPIRGQGVWLKDSEISAIVEHAKGQGKPQYDQEVVNVGAVAMEGGGSGGGGAGTEWVSDRQFHEAVQAMYRYQKTGADFFRRKMGIGYNKATAYVEQLEDLGFVGPQRGTAPREITKSWDDWIELLKDNGVEWGEDDEFYRNPVALGDG
ncbi:MAG: DNA translocase FtsK [Planctomycetes bacterium]|nr:DNA translocase FtsK [Planctomycetota bacterium]